MPESKEPALVVYFSHSGNTRALATQIQQRVDGELFEITLVEPYPAEYRAVVAQAKRELASDYVPELKARIKNLALYDVIFIGYPNWCGTLPRPVAALLMEYDFSGKTIAPFCTHEGSALGRSVLDLSQLCQLSVITEGLAVRGTEVNNAQSAVSAWLDALGRHEYVSRSSNE